jgi:ribosomal-protein-alanine N-acetyltransferase
MNESFPLLHPKYLNLSLSPLVIDDASEIFTNLNDEETAKHLVGPPYPVSMTQVEDYISSRPSVNGYQLAFAIRHNGKLIGEVSIVPRKIPGTYELGYYICRSYWNNGITSAAVKLYLNIVLKQINVGEDITIEAAYIKDNTGSEKVLRKCGFTEVGHEEKTKNGKILHGVKMRRIISGKESLVDLDYSCN